ncbi:uncharacterized protein ALTATR162_LOCUS2377 [Alternaria atra]|uniref:Uncharacterized protein n=1 Tax=Alternaria atra TaxID=119953 RepID=A0A8J2HXV5_9PLEO|nr:uncharacterized protein ALTATR162_LOCUS2377 [Alternaria atra]CAG5149478.1 unnamed protein product [Alternaria atra]
MFKIVSSNAYPQHEGLVEEEGLYIDASASQYLRAPGVYAVRRYPVDPRRAAARPPRCTHLGGAYMVHLQELCETTRWRNSRLEAIIRTVDNEVYGKITGLGGPSILANKSVGEWKDLEQWILASINVSLQSLVAKLDHVHIPPGVDRETHHKLIATDCFGTGHENIIGSLERVSGGVQVTRWQNP